VLEKELSVEAAAAECPEQIALIVEGRSYNFDELAKAVASFDGSYEFAPARDFESIVRIYAALQRKEPLRLFHPALTAQELAGLPREGDVDHETCLAVLFTSGSSGVPKGVILSRKAFLASAQSSAKNLAWEDNDRWLLNLPLCHVGGLSVLTRCLISRKTVVLEEDFRLAAEKYKITLASLVPTQLQRLLPNKVPKSLRAVLVGGAPMSRELRQSALQAQWPVLSTYGMTETCSQLATWPFQEMAKPHENVVGRLLDGVEAKTVNGELFVRGPILFDGYLGEKPRDSQEWFATGDLAEIRENDWLAIRGRSSDMIISGGENVQPREIEDWLLGLSGVESAIVLGCSSKEWGQVVAAVYTGTRPENELREAAQQSLARHKQPKKYLCLDSLPLLSNGKVDRQKLLKRLSYDL